MPPGASAVFASEGKNYVLAVLTGSPIPNAEFYPLDSSLIANAAQQPSVPLAKGVRIALSGIEDGGIPTKELAGVVKLPDGVAYAIAAIPGIVPPITTGRSSHLLAAGLAQALGFAFLGGIILNLMPCVFPILFLKGSRCCMHRARSAKRCVLMVGSMLSISSYLSGLSSRFC